MRVIINSSIDRFFKKMNILSYKTLLQNQYIEEILQFNFSPLNWLHKSWHKDFGFDELNYWVSNSHTRRQVQKILLKKMGLYSNYEFRFNDPVARIVLLPSMQLESLAFFTGVLRYNEYFESTTLKLTFSSKEYEKRFLYFTYNIAPFLLDKNTFKKYCYSLGDVDPDSITKTQLFLEGTKQLIAVIKYGSSAVKSRFIYKMPKNTVAFEDNANDIDEEHENQILDIKSLLKIFQKINYLTNEHELNSQLLSTNEFEFLENEF